MMSNSALLQGTKPAAGCLPASPAYCPHVMILGAICRTHLSSTVPACLGRSLLNSRPLTPSASGPKCTALHIIQHDIEQSRGIGSQTVSEWVFNICGIGIACFGNQQKAFWAVTALAWCEQHSSAASNLCPCEYDHYRPSSASPVTPRDTGVRPCHAGIIAGQHHHGVHVPGTKMEST
jgi:hypothetical protein